jgi:outer membrane usher protein
MRRALLLLVATLPAALCIAQAASDQQTRQIDARADDSQLTEVWLSVSVNGQDADHVALALQTPDGRILVSSRDLRSWRLPMPASHPIEHMAEHYYLLDSFAGLTYRVAGPEQTLNIDAPASLFTPVTLEGRAAGFNDPTPSPLGAFLNYDAVSQHTDHGTSTSALLEGNVFGPFGTGVVRLLERPAQIGDAGSVRLESTWTRDDPLNATTFRLGDSVTGASGSWGGAVRFGGMQWASNFLTRPGLVTMPLPGVTGEAALPSTLDLYVNGALQAQHSVPPGPFDLRDIPIVTGEGDIRLVVHDALGREQIITQSYYASPQMLRKGLSDYSYEIGFTRDNFGIVSNDYGRALLVGTHRTGLTDRLTGEFHGELLRDQQTLGVGAAYLLPAAGVLGASFAGSHTDRGTGGLLALTIERNGRHFGFGMNAQWASPDFTSLGLASGQSAPLRTLQEFVQVGFGSLGSVGLSSTRREYRDRAPVQLLSVQQNTRLGQLGYLSLSVLRILTGKPDTVATLFFSCSVGERTSMTLSTTSQAGGLGTSLQVQKNLPAGNGIGYGITAGAGDTATRQASLALQSDIGTYSLEADAVSGSVATRISASGSVALLAGQVLAGRRINDSFAVAQVLDSPAVHLYSDNQPAGRTNESGYVLIPRLRPYQANVIGIDPADLPLDVAIDTTQMTAVPYAHSGVFVRFPLSRPHGALLSIVLETGEPLPAGAVIEHLGAPPELARFPTGMRGEAYVTGLDSLNRLRAKWDGRTCEFSVQYVQSEDPLPRLGPYICREGAQ